MTSGRGNKQQQSGKKNSLASALVFKPSSNRASASSSAAPSPVPSPDALSSRPPSVHDDDELLPPVNPMPHSSSSSVVDPSHPSNNNFHKDAHGAESSKRKYVDESTDDSSNKKKPGEEEVESDEEDDEGIGEQSSSRISLVKDVNYKERMRILLASFSEDQIQRYESYRRATFPESTIKRFVGNILSQPVSKQIATVIRGFSKVFVGEIVEEARRVQQDWGVGGPLRPEHLREAYRRYKDEQGGLTPSTLCKKPRLF